MIYLVDFETCYKIGKTQNLKKRLQSFLVDREKVVCLDIIMDQSNRLNSRDTDSSMEKEIHKKCKEFHIAGELFQKDPKVLEIFKDCKAMIGDSYDYASEIAELCKTLRVSKQKGYDNLIHGQNKKKVYQYDKQGVLIGEYSSMLEAMKKTGARADKVICGRQSTSAGFVWSDKLLSESEIKAMCSKNKTLNQYSLDGEYIKSWNTMSEAGKELGIAVSSISLCCKGKYKKVGGFIWKIE